MNMRLATAVSNPDRQVRWSYRDIPLSYGAHQCGRVAWTPSPQSVGVESQLEASVARFLIQQPRLIALHSQPFTLSYLDSGTSRRYTPDFLAVYDRVPPALRRLGFARWTVVEVKPQSDLDSQTAQVTRRLTAVREQLGLAAVCLTDRDLAAGRD